MIKLTAPQAEALSYIATNEPTNQGALAMDLAATGTLADKKTAKRVLDQLTKKGLLELDPETYLVVLSEQGQAEAGQREPEAEEAPVQEELELEAEVEEEDIIGSEDAAEEAPAPEKQVAIETDTYKVTEWSTYDSQDREEQWTETIFTDGSKTLRRRKKVSGAWRTDFWGTEAGAEKQVFTSAKAAKMARAYGSFSSLV